MKTSRWAGLAIAISMLAGRSAGAAVVPDKPSNLVTLYSAGDNSSCQGFPQFSRRLLADGTFVDFTVPAKQVLVITGVEVSGQGFSPNRRQPIRILETPYLLPKVTVYDQVDALGFVGAYQPITPVAVKSGSALCLEVFNGLTTGTLYGFLQSDR